MNEISEKAKQMHERLIDTFHNKINIEGITILTGNNGSGKSLIRNQIPFLFKNKYEVELKDMKGWILSTSMQARTESRPEHGALSSIMHDTPWIATSQNTFHAIKQIIKTIKEKENNTKYLIIDEYEIGCSEETIMALAIYLDSKLQALLKEKKIEGAMIITHSRIGLKHIKHDHFVNIEGLTEEEWLTREIIPTDLEFLDKNELFFLIQQKENS